MVYRNVCYEPNMVMVVTKIVKCQAKMSTEASTDRRKSMASMSFVRVISCTLTLTG